MVDCLESAFSAPSAEIQLHCLDSPFSTSLFISVLKIFTNSTMGQQKRSADGSQAGMAAQSEGLKL